MNGCNVIIITDHIRKSLTPQIEWTVGCSIQRHSLTKPLATLSRKQVLQSFHENFETEQITHDTARLITARSPSKTLLPSRIEFLFYFETNVLTRDGATTVSFTYNKSRAKFPPLTETHKEPKSGPKSRISSPSHDHNKTKLSTTDLSPL